MTMNNHEYSEGIMSGGSVILKDGEPMTTEEIVIELMKGQSARAEIARGTPDGWKLVPIEPTEAMMRDAADNLCGQFGTEFVRPKERFARAVYQELLRFAPQPGKQGANP